ncbi:unnamed protein product [Hydatigera taeniaeformis]|uniref:UBX domain-containing protein n=1 Tax=Hydatigena taeniaeformis TaxID=6205 RepID=A0A0R3WV91_HYDTA|nr:unnamed protein product [Hydatigera taeniaeformis]
MHIDSPLDSKVKGTMIKDMLNLTGFNLPSTKDVSSGNTRTSAIPLPCGILNINPGIYDSHFTSKQAINPTSNEDSSNKSETLKWMEEIKKPTAPPHPWLLDRRVTMSRLSDDERKKHEYYVLRAYEACLSGLDQTTHTSRHQDPPTQNVIQPRIQLDLESLPPPTTPKESTISTSISQGAGPDSLDLAAFMKLREDHKRAMARRRLEHKQLLHRANIQVLGETEDRWEATKDSNETPVGEKRCEGDNLNLAEEPKSKTTKSPTALEQFRWAVENVLDFITPSDLRCLVQMLDAKNRAGAFQPVFPADNISTTASYLRFFEKPRYPNLLIFAYLDRYGESVEGEFLPYSNEPEI